ncbi:MAG TPA: zinc ribbon domain-containing protein [Bryobacteraceae bacterium]|jgi:hypothetical protein
MPDFCSCGAQLPPDAVFCHKCGKPQRAIGPEERAEEPVIVLTPPPAVDVRRAEPAAMGFHNPVAVRIAFIVALVTIVTTLLGQSLLLSLILWVAAGFFAVLFYSRRTGQSLNVKAGLRMGWITGVLLYGLTTVLFVVSIVAVSAKGGITAAFQAQFKNNTDPNVQEALKLLQSGPGLATLLILTLIMLFVFITSLSMAGGALGAKMVGRD